METILTTIDNIFQISLYWLPGFIFLVVLKKMISNGWKWTSENNIFAVIISIAIDFLFRALDLSRIVFFQAESHLCFLYCVIGFTLALALSLMYRCGWVNRIFSFIFIKSIHSSIWDDVIDYRNGTMLNIRLNNGNVIYGGFHTVEEKGNDSWLALDCYHMKNSTDKEICRYAKSNDGHYLLIRVSDIVYAEVIQPTNVNTPKE